MNEIEVIVVATVKGVIEGLAMTSFDDIGRVTGCDFEGNEYTFSADEYAESCKDMGCFGYNDEPNSKIYIWFDKSVGVGKLVNLLAHEMAHQTEKEANKNDLIKSELDACRCDDIAEWAYNKAIDLLQKKRESAKIS